MFYKKSKKKSTTICTLFILENQICSHFLSSKQTLQYDFLTNLDIFLYTVEHIWIFQKKEIRNIDFFNFIKQIKMYNRGQNICAFLACWFWTLKPFICSFQLNFFFLSVILDS